MTSHSIRPGGLAALEQTIERGIATFIEVGAALAEIRERRLYRATHPNFETYCRERWGWTRQYAGRVLAASTIAAELVPIGTTPTHEGQVRPLTKLKDPEDRQAAWDEAVDEAEGDQPTAEQVDQSVGRRMVDRSAAALPEDERDSTVVVATMGGRHWQIAHRVLDHLATLEEEDRAEIYALSESDEPTDQSLAMTRSLGAPPMPNRALSMLKDAYTKLDPASHHVSAPMAAVLVELAARVREQRSQLQALQ